MPPEDGSPAVTFLGQPVAGLEIKGPSCMFGHLGQVIDPENYVERFRPSEGNDLLGTWVASAIDSSDWGHTLLALSFRIGQAIQDKNGSWGLALAYIEFSLGADITYPEGFDAEEVRDHANSTLNYSLFTSWLRMIEADGRDRHE